MPNILCIETSTTVCSVAIGNEHGLLAHKEINEGYTHAENLHVYIDEVLNFANLNRKDIAAISVGKGPGSYTGLRIGVSAAKGIAYALNIPLISMNTLLNLCIGAKKHINSDSLLCPMLDARRMEVYTALYDSACNEINPTQALIVGEESIAKLATNHAITFFGDGAAKCKEYSSRYATIHFLENQFPSAKNMVDYSVEQFVNRRFEDVAYFEPFYLKEFYTGK